MVHGSFTLSSLCLWVPSHPGRSLVCCLIDSPPESQFVFSLFSSIYLSIIYVSIYRSMYLPIIYHQSVIYLFLSMSICLSIIHLCICLSAFRSYLSSICLKTKVMFSLFDNKYVWSDAVSESQREALERTSFLGSSALLTLEWNVCS